MEIFVIRLWHPAGAFVGVADVQPDLDGLHGFVEHSASGLTRPFRSGSELVGLIASWTAAPRDVEASAPSPSEANR